MFGNSDLSQYGGHYLKRFSFWRVLEKADESIWLRKGKTPDSDAHRNGCCPKLIIDV
jgi:hypothetical protein